MIHVDVKCVDRKDIVADAYDYIVQTSTDGAGWKTQYVFSPTIGDTEEQVKSHAEDTARIFMNGCQYAGALVRGTSCGYGL